ncbi:hypothetical protein A3A49_00940 [Candidatus Curtissbacteria bacterium RIFCSPLOWO2_01_FULL_38_11b]|uniref:Peptidase A2 domain-containing protein n=1 Tax=Candidatus Curtissbacteria bacterium RIFCSPLOWO2_01_FULL_38_11b TaxID=1797725 RepID=A0A1F5GZA6_9BACT|nr:MAG: hypothetical protein A3A49_00940 [Candidatus Curtissbacteria bacterium RIFCSPLOWO2_01_FULL_38_11b]
MKFDYVEISSKIARPIILVTISFEDKFLLTEALIDSGSDYCIFPLEAATALNIPIEKSRKTYLTGFLEGRADLYLCPIKLTVGNYSVEVLAGFAKGMSMYVPCTLGQKGFFDNFKVCFDKKIQKVDITPI